MRPRTRFLTLLTLLLVLLTACSNPNNDTAAPAASQPDEGLFYGSLADAPQNPQRVVSLWRTGTILADLGVKPVAAMEGEFLDTELAPEVYREYSDIPTVGSSDGVNPDKVIEAKPDLIIGMDNGGLTVDYAELAKIAPVIILKIAEPTDVWRNYPKVAELVGASTTYQEQQTRLDAALAEIEQQHGERTAALQTTAVHASDGTIWVDTSKSLTYQRLTAAGFGYNPAYTDNPERYVTELSLENVPDLAGQDIIFYDTYLDGTVPSGTKEVMDTASFKRLPAVKKGNVFPLTSGTIYTFESAQRQIDDLRHAAESYRG